MKWTFRGDVPIYLQLVNQIRLMIVSGGFEPGQRLPTVRDIAAEAGVNPNTMQRAMSELERTGLVFSQRTTGRYVTEDVAVIGEARRQLALERASEFLKTMKELGYSAHEAAAMLSREGELSNDSI